MKRIKINLWGVLILCSLILLSCGGGEKANQAATQQSAFDEMMAIHDEVMPKMGAINRLSRQLKDAQTSVDSTNRSILGEIDQAIRALETADQGMMAWMNANAGGKLAKMQAEQTHAEILEYIKNEEDNIKEVRDNMNSSIEQAEALLKQIAAPKE